MQGDGPDAYHTGYFCGAGSVQRGEDPSRTGAATVSGVPARGTGTFVVASRGGIGTRGPGEKKLEMDRRLIRERISRLKKELKEVEQHRELIRTQRKESHRKVAALVGYTSAGKSSIENALTGAGILEDAMLFSTLDTTTRALELGGKQTVLLTDTVGFIRKLPHHLVEAFKSTLEEAIYADIIIMWLMRPIRRWIHRCMLCMRRCASSA